MRKIILLLILLVLFLSGCATTHKWENRHNRIMEPPQAERFF